MPLQNRVNPYGSLLSVSARGNLLGNRGVLHNEEKKIVRPWERKAWITCVLAYPGYERAVFEPKVYSQLFFLDEATSFAAGHRPCGACRHSRFQEFKSQWVAANPEAGAVGKVPIASIDKLLHAERAIRGGGKVTYEALIETLPLGTFIEREGHPFLVGDDRLLPWTFYGYEPPMLLPEPGTEVTVLTPASIVRLFQQGFRPQVDESANFTVPL